MLCFRHFNSYGESRYYGKKITAVIDKALQNHFHHRLVLSQKAARPVLATEALATAPPPPSCLPHAAPLPRPLWSPQHKSKSASLSIGLTSNM